MFFFISLHLFLFYSIHGQKFTISGTVTDGSTGETLISANVYNPDNLSGTVTNLYGFYSLKFNPGQIKIVYSFIGYSPKTINIYLTQDTTINMSLEPVIELEEVVVSDNAPRQQVQASQMGLIKINPSTIDKIPVLLGETDLIKTLQLMPGVQGGTEGTSGFYVRGGGPDQNLILLDGVPVYNVNHLFGFMSVFNSDAIRNVDLIKGGFPARYGGRLSSVLDIRMKEGNMHEFKGSGSIGIISSKLTLEGPIIKNKTSFMVSGRRSYFDILTYPFQLMINENMNDYGNTTVGYFLQDFNGKINHRFNDHHRVYFSTYTGKDKFFLNDRYEQDIFMDNSRRMYTSRNQAGLQWGNFTSALRWNYIINNELFSNLTATVSNYKFDIFDDYEEVQKDDGGKIIYEDNYFFEYLSQIRDYGIKLDFDYIPGSNHYLRFGMGNTYHRFSPGVTVEKINMTDAVSSIDTTYGNKNIPANEFNIYVEDDYNINRNLLFNFGLHYSGFSIEKTIYHSFQPRLAIRWLVTPDLSFKASYVEMQQYLHLLANSSMGLPTDLWVPATSRTKPQDSWQLSAGGTFSLKNEYEITLEAYYKKMDNLVDYAEGASFFELNMGDWEDLITTGEGESYGAELLLRRNSGRLTGWIGYTLSWSNRHFEEISFGRKFPYRYDSRHDISIVTSYKINDKYDISAAWIFRTGYPFTLEDQKFMSPLTLFRWGRYTLPNSPTLYYGQVLPHFETRNNYRMPDYHRLDLGVNKHKEKKNTERTWSFGAYNAYGRANPFMIYPADVYNEQTGEVITRLKQLSIFTFIPYVRWSIKF